MNNAVLRLVGVGLFALGLGGLSSPAEGADLKLMVEPIYTPDRQAEVYKPLIDYLNGATGHKITLLTPRNYHFFWRDIRQNAPVDLVFAEAHFTDYRITRFQSVPLVRTAERTSYTLLGSDQLTETRLATMVGRNIVTMPSPSMGFALLLEFFPSPVAQPNILSTASSWRDGVEIVFAGEADAAMVPTWLKDQYPNLLPIQTSREFAGAAFTASATVDPQVQQDIKVALLKLHENPDAYNVINELGVTQFVETSAAEYQGAEQVLKGFFGYE